MKYTINVDMSPNNADGARDNSLHDPSKVYYSMVGLNNSKPSTSREQLIQKNLRLSNSSKSYQTNATSYHRSLNAKRTQQNMGADSEMTMQ